MFASQSNAIVSKYSTLIFIKYVYVCVCVCMSVSHLFEFAYIKVVYVNYA